MLGRHWEPGEATIIASEGFYAFLGGTGCSSREYVVDVRPAASGPIFRTKINVQYTAPEGGAQEPYRRLVDGEVVPVECDQKRQKAKFDESALRRAEPTSGAGGPTAFEAAAAAAPGTPAPAAASSGVPPESALVGGLSLAEILATGVPARVVVVESDVWSPPTTDKAGDPVYRFLLTVMQDGLDPFRSEEAQGVPPYALPLIYPGANLVAKVATGGQVAIDWEAAQREASTTGRP